MVNEFLQRFEVLLAVALLIPAISLALLAVLNREIIFWRYASIGMLCISLATALSAAAYFGPTLGLILTSNLLCVFGYYLCSKSIRQIYSFKRLKWLEESGLLVFTISFIFVLLSSNSYENLAATLSLCIVCFSLFWGVLAALSFRRSKSTAAALIVILSIAYGGVAAARAVAALHANQLFPPLSFWDPIFIIFSLAATFLFSLAQFMHGYDLIQGQNVQKLQQITNYLTTERELSSKLKEANEEQKNLQSLLLHEFKRPLSALHAALQAENDDAPHDGRADDTSRKLRRHIAEASTLLEGIGEYDELSALFQNPNKTMVTTHAIAEDLRLKWRISVTINDSSSDVYADQFLIDIALGNLIENAQKFGRTEEGACVTISSTFHYVFFDVKDDGPGIPKAEWANVWRKFYRIGLRSENAVRGCGLGLHTVKSIAEVHGGYAEIVSQAPSVARFALPRISKRSSDA